MLGSQASSRIRSLERWINFHQAFSEPITISPLLSKDVVDKVMSADEIKVLRIKYDGDQLGSIRRQNRLSGTLEALESGHGNIDVELILRVTGRVNERKQAERQNLLQTARSMIRSSYKKASADLINYDAEGRHHMEHVDFLNNVLARRMEVSVKDEEGNPVRIPSAIAAIERAAQVLDDELHGR
jgi:hypothetical protein